jgi:hypothetical protein
MKVNIMELRGTVASIAGGNGRLDQTVQLMSNASPSGDTLEHPQLECIVSTAF